MKILIICDTYYQLIIAVQMKLTFWRDTEVDLFLSNHSNGAKSIADRLKNITLFAEIKYIESKEFTYKNSLIKNVKDIVEYNFGRLKCKELKKYDEILFYGLNLYLYAIQDYYDFIRHDVRWSRYEEGLLSYDTDFAYGKRVSLTRKLRKISGRNDIVDKIDRYYCFFPELKQQHKEWNFCKIPVLTESSYELKEILNYIFNYKSVFYKQKYIFFASSSDIDGQSFGETEIILKLANKVGKENLLIKMHPRDTRSIYENRGIAVMRESSIPWEIIQMNEDLSRHVLLTVNSGAFLSITAILKQQIQGVFLYPQVSKKDKAFLSRAYNIRSILLMLHSNNMCCRLIECDEVLEDDDTDEVRNKFKKK